MFVCPCCDNVTILAISVSDPLNSLSHHQDSELSDLPLPSQISGRDPLATTVFSNFVERFPIEENLLGFPASVRQDKEKTIEENLLYILDY